MSWTTNAFIPYLDWADAVIWLAALVGDPACALNPGVTEKINVDTVDWLCRTFDGRIIFPSTCSVYGANEQQVDEKSATDPLSLYAKGKLEAESVIMRRRPDSLIFRLATLAGVGDTYSRIRMDLVVNLLVMRAKLVGQLQVFGGEQYRPMLHVRDVATAIVPQIKGDASGIYNLGAENDTIADHRGAHRCASRIRRDCAHRCAFPGHAQLPGQFRSSRTGARVQARILDGRCD
jgi:nucleoside-diphosphate-sugar epimerase